MPLNQTRLHGIAVEGHCSQLLYAVRPKRQAVLYEAFIAIITLYIENVIASYKPALRRLHY